MENKNKDIIIDDTKTVAKPQHPLGKLIDVKVHSLSLSEKGSAIFVSINEHTFEFHQGTEVSIPEAVVTFLEQATQVGSTLNDKGYPEPINVPAYAVSRV